MGKETKIGLAVIGTLMSVFGFLLFKHFAASTAPSPGSEEARAPVEPLSSEGMDKPTVVASEEPSGLNSKLWDDPATSDEPAAAAYQAAGEAVDEIVDEFAQDAAAAADPYASSTEPSRPDFDFEPAASEGDVAANEPSKPDFGNAPTSSGPFQSQAIEPADAVMEVPPAEVAESAASELPLAQAKAAGSNPLRRLSAEVPVEDGSAAAPDMGLPAADPYANSYESDPYAAEAPAPAAKRDPFETPAATSDTAAVSDPFENYGSEPAQPAGQQPRAQQPTAPADDWAADASGDIPDATPQAAAPANDGYAFDRYESPAQPTTPAATEPAPPRSTAAEPTPAKAFDPYDSQPRRQTAQHDWQSMPANGPGPTAAQPSTVRPATVEPAAARPLPVENGQYTVQPGDTLWSISEAVYGTGGYFKALGAKNRSLLPRSDKLTVGSQIAVPPVAELERDFPALCPKARKSALVQPGAVSQAAAQRRANNDVYIVAEGDTLFDIARYELGKASRWAEIYQLNRDVLGEDFDYLRPGTELVMPAQEQTATRAGGSRY